MIFQIDPPLSIELPPKESKTDRKRGAGSNKLTPSSSLASFVSAGIVSAPTSVASIPVSNAAAVASLNSSASKRQRVGPNDPAILLGGSAGSRGAIIPNKTSPADYLSSLVHHQHSQQLQQFSSSLAQAQQANNRLTASEHAHRLASSDYLFSSHTVEDLLNHGYSAASKCSEIF